VGDAGIEANLKKMIARDVEVQKAKPAPAAAPAAANPDSGNPQ
jgi:hypothetical protein